MRAQGREVIQTSDTDGPSPTQSSRELCRLGPFTFDAASGEVIDAADPAATPTRLPPKPAALLQLLVEAHPGVASHRLIRETLWPDVVVDYDQSVHQCVRQIRAALGDSASAARYVETIPRRGYRLVVAPIRQGDPSSAPPDPLPEETPRVTPDGLSDTGHPADRPPSGVASALESRPRSMRVPTLLALLVGSMLSAIVLFVATRSTSERTDVAAHTVDRTAGTAAARALRVGIMPFEVVGGTGQLTSENDFAERLLVRLQREADSRAARSADGASSPGFELVGPTSTTPFARRGADLSDVVDDLGLDYLINGRFLDDGETPFALLAELVRADGAHVWVERVEEFPGDSSAVDDLIERLAVATATEIDTSSHNARDR